MQPELLWALEIVSLGHRDLFGNEKHNMKDNSMC